MSRPWTVSRIFWTLFCLLSLGGFIVLYLVFNQARIPDQDPKRCLSHVKQLGFGLEMYSYDHDGVLPEAGTWMDSIEVYTLNTLLPQDPEDPLRHPYGYAFRNRASRMKAASVSKPETFALIFDSTIHARNGHSETWSMPRPGTHEGQDTVGYLDGHARRVSVP